MSFFELHDLTVGYGKTDVIRGLSLSLEKGTLNGILGANGCGKTTALKAICGILPHGGQSLLGGVCLESLSPRQMARLCSYIPQRSGITISMSALDVVLMGFNPSLGLLQHPNEDMKRRAAKALAKVGLEERLNDDYLTLSEGQKQLCILARMLVSDAKLLLLDEPESALDFRLRYRMLTALQDRIAQTGGAALVTLHDGALALNHCDRLFLIADGTLHGILSPKTDPIETMETQLSEIFGEITLTRCRDRSGREHLVMMETHT